jgi:broad specificity phosphatase PhoE
LAKIILVRHGETEWNKQHRIQGSNSDNPLNEAGLRQAGHLALYLKDEKIEAVYSSPLQRAMRTAQAIAEYHGLEVVPLSPLKEIDMGELEGILSAGLKLRFDEFICRSGEDRQPDRIPGGESVCDVQKRAWEAMKNIARRHPGATVAAVTHYFVIMAVVCQVLNLPLAHLVRLKLDPGSITAFTLDGNTYPRLELFNERCHLV